MGRTLSSITLTDPDLTPLAVPADIKVAPTNAFVDIRRSVTEGGGVNSAPRGTLRAMLPSAAHDLAEALTLGRTLRLVFTLPASGGAWGAGDDTASPPQDVEYWRVERLDAVEAPGFAGGEGYEVTCRPIEDDLAESVARYTYPDGTVDPYVSVYELTVPDALGFILQDCGQPGGRTSYLSGNVFLPGNVATDLQAVEVTFAAEGASHEDLLLMLVEACAADGNPARIVFRNETGRVYVDVEEAPPVGSYGASIASVGTEHIIDLRRSEDDDGRPTALVPLGGEEGAAFTIGDLKWEVANYTSSGGGPGIDVVDVRTPIYVPGEEVGPVWASDALIGLYLGNDADGWAEIVDSSFPSSVSTDGSRPFALTEIVYLAADNTGTEVAVMRSHELSATDPAHEQVRRYRNASPVPNLLEVNDVSADFSDLSTWENVDADVITPAPSGTVDDGGNLTQELTASTVGDGIQSPLMDLDTVNGPYASAYLAAEATEGAWLVELVDGEGNVFPPADAEDRPTIDVDDADQAIALAGFEVEPTSTGGSAGTRQVRLRITALELDGTSGNAVIDLNVATVTQSAVEYQYRPGLGPHELWRRAARELRRLAQAPTAEYSGEIADPNVLAGDIDVAIGAAVTLTLPSGASVDVPITALEEQLVVNGTSIFKRVTLGYPEIDAAEAFGGALGLEARPGRGRQNSPRPLPESDLVVGVRREQKRITRSSALGALSAKDAVDYDTTDIVNKPTLGALAAEDTADWDTQIVNKPDLAEDSRVTAVEEELWGVGGTAYAPVSPSVVTDKLEVVTDGDISGTLGQDKITDLNTDLADKLTSLGYVSGALQQTDGNGTTTVHTFGDLADKNAVDYSTAEIVNKPTLGALAPLDEVADGQVAAGAAIALTKIDGEGVDADLSVSLADKLTALGYSAGVLQQTDGNGTTTVHTFGDLADKDSVDYDTADIINKPTLGALAAEDEVSNKDVAAGAAIALSKVESVTIGGLSADLNLEASMDRVVYANDAGKSVRSIEFDSESVTFGGGKVTGDASGIELEAEAAASESAAALKMVHPTHGTCGYVKGYAGGATDRHLHLQSPEYIELKADFEIELTTDATTGVVTLTCNNLVVPAAEIDFTAVPTSDPNVAGRLWRDGTDLKISTG